MISLAALAPSAAIAQPPRPDAAWRGADVKAANYRLGRWLIRVQRDRFRDMTTCQVWSHGVSVSGGVVRFSFGGGVDTTAAVVRFDQSPPVSAAAFAVRAAGFGARLESGGLSNPSGGNVFIPLSDLRRDGDWTRWVSIQPSRASRHRDFNLAGLEAAVAAAQGQGCGVES